MLIPKNNANQMRTRILVKIVEKFLQGRFADADRIPLELRPKGGEVSRCCIYKDRAILKYRCMASMGFAPEDETDELTSLKEYGERALARSEHAVNKLSVITDACSGCIRSRYLVTDACRGCFAKPCQVNCPKQAITIVNGRSTIDPDKCISCGRCQEVCPYHAVIRVPIPCEEACPVGAISKDESGKEHIDPEKCILCGKCLQSCPFGAVVEMSQMVDVLKLLADENKKVVAMLAPAVLGQFPGTINNLIGALKKLGFADVVEVAIGADITTRKEAAEFIEKRKRRKDDDHFLLPGLLQSCGSAHPGNQTFRFPHPHADVLHRRTAETGTAGMHGGLCRPLSGQTLRGGKRSQRRLCADV